MIHIVAVFPYVRVVVRDDLAVAGDIVNCYRAVDMRRSKEASERIITGLCRRGGTVSSGKRRARAERITGFG